MAMHANLHRALMACRPLYLRGLLLDGQYRLPFADRRPAPRRPRSLLVALTSLLHLPVFKGVKR